MIWSYQQHKTLRRLVQQGYGMDALMERFNTTEKSVRSQLSRLQLTISAQRVPGGPLLRKGKITSDAVIGDPEILKEKIGGVHIKRYPPGYALGYLAPVTAWAK